MKKGYSRLSIWLMSAAIAIALISLLFVVITVFDLVGRGQKGTYENTADEAAEPSDNKPHLIRPDHPHGTPARLPEEEPGKPDIPEESDEPEETELPEVSRVVKVAGIAWEYPGVSIALDDLAKSYNCASVSIAVFDGEYDYYTYQYGYANINQQRPIEQDTKMRVASLSKTVVAICAMTLVDKGKLDLDADISEYLGYTVRNPRYDDTLITARMLMQHTSSIYDSNAFFSSRSGYSSRSTRNLLDEGTSYLYDQPGTRHEYTNFGYSVLANVCEMITGKPLDTFTRDILLAPLGIDAGFLPKNISDTESIAAIYDENHKMGYSEQSQLQARASGELGHDHHLAQGNLTISALDYARIIAMLANGGILDGVRILSEEAVMEMEVADFDKETYKQALAMRYQENVFAYGDSFYWHTGSAYGIFAQYMYDAETGRGAVVITTGATIDRTDSGMVNTCTDMIGRIWKGLDFMPTGPLTGMVVCVDPGHQGRADSATEPVAPGSSEKKAKVSAGTAGSYTGVEEYALNLEVGLKLRDKLEELGATVLMTRTSNDVNVANSQRAILANTAGADMMIRIHANGSDDSSVSGYMVLVPGSKYTPDIVSSSTRMARILDSIIKQRVTIPSRGLVTRDDLAGFNWLEVPGILLEMGYMTNKTDDVIMQTAEYQAAVVEAIAEALIQYRR